MSLASVIKNEVEALLDKRKLGILEAIEDELGPNELIARTIHNYDVSAEYAADALHDVVVDHLATSREWVEKDDHEAELDVLRDELDQSDLVELLDRLGIDEHLLSETSGMDPFDRVRRAIGVKSFRDAVCALAQRCLEHEERNPPPPPFIPAGYLSGITDSLRRDDLKPAPAKRKREAKAVR